MRRLRLRATLLVLAGLWLLGFSFAALAQRADLERLDRQVNHLEREQQQAAVALESRLTKLETSLDVQTKLLSGIGGAVLLLIAETGIAIVSRRRGGT